MEDENTEDFIPTIKNGKEYYIKPSEPDVLYCKKCHQRVYEEDTLCSHCNNALVVSMSVKPEFTYTYSKSSNEVYNQPKKKSHSTVVKIVIWCVIVVLITSGIIYRRFFYHEHDWKSIDCQTLEVCKICGKESKNYGEHSWSEKEIIREATCEEDGLETTECVVCGIKNETIIKKLGHDFEDIKILKEATCETPGKKTVKCNRCKLTKEVVISKLPHNYKDYFCVNCGYEDRPISINLSTTERANTKKVHYISSVNCEYKNNQLTFYYCLMDDKKEEITVPAYARIIIKDRWGTIKYRGYKLVDRGGTVSSIFGTKIINMVNIDSIYLSSSDWGKLGTLEYEVFSPGNWGFNKDTIDIYD